MPGFTPRLDGDSWRASVTGTVRVTDRMRISPGGSGGCLTRIARDADQGTFTVYEIMNPCRPRMMGHGKSCLNRAREPLPPPMAQCLAPVLSALKLPTRGRLLHPYMLPECLLAVLVGLAVSAVDGGLRHVSHMWPSAGWARCLHVGCLISSP